MTTEQKIENSPKELASEQLISWQNLLPTLPLDNDFFDTSLSEVDFFSLQPRAKSAVDLFLKNSYRSLLVLKADDQAEYAPLLQEYIEQKLPADKEVIGVKYTIEQGDSFSFPQIYLEQATSIEDNFAGQKKVASALFFDQSQLFGSVLIHPSSHDIQLNAGLVHQLNNGVLILSVAALLEQFDVWLRLKQLLLSGVFSWYSLNPLKTLPCSIPDYPLNLKVIILGNRSELATLSELEEELYHFADYAEIESYFSFDNSQSYQDWASYVYTVAKTQEIELSREGINALYQFLVRESEDRYLVSISPLKLKEILLGAQLLSGKQSLSAVDFQLFFQQKEQQHSFLREQTYRDILQEQIFIATEGEMIGQINGLSVIEYPGTPVSFGEPSRISCIVQFGDGEIIDIERKSELAGNIHGKSIMIAETCLAGVLDLPSQLPFSASIAFEQSYGDIDGDSASLAVFCALLSALSDLPLPQNIAVTGAIDQFGLVHTVGGVNQKIEGFFEICQRRELNGTQGVIVPSAVLNQLSLSNKVIDAVRQEKFFIWAVEDIFQATEILFKRHLASEPDIAYTEKNLPIVDVIQQRLEDRAEQHKGRFWHFFFNRR
ncbi:peptidase [Canicola haemoglobinophilus]|uniref:endopeptidase La n=1 Tax=Canicola haemoglobinophilus TaxID=733 RepID=A0A1V4AZK2_9PAST|nr:Lon protease family protein [Canicola haemoglobinophilus]OOR98632.1 peptidase [Canicola haemoglobinophilus]STO60609.1 ATP-dependent Lon protease [Canicola haemoglobinophilus]